MEASPPPSDAPRKAPLPRVGTFRTARPTSTGPAGLRRGSTVLSRPQSFSGPGALLRESEDSPVPAPRLRRGSSFVASRARTSQTEDVSPTLQLRRGASRRSNAAAGHGTGGAGARPSSRRLPRAGTFAFGSSGALPDVVAGRDGDGGSLTSNEDVRRPSETDRKERGERTCGMCSGCGVGLKGMPPWAPERLAVMTTAERSAVFRDLQHKEERGRLEAELRKKRLSDMEAVRNRLEKRRGGRVELENESASEGRRSGSRAEEEDFYELESVDLGTELGSQRSGSRTSKRRSRSANGSTGEEEFGADISAAVEEKGEGKKGRVRGRRLDEDCAQCGELEGKVQDLEEQLGVLREVVSMRGDGSERGEDGKSSEDDKKPKTWKDKVISAYFGGSTVSNSERSRLRGEVDALRKATDLLFQKLQQNGK